MYTKYDALTVEEVRKGRRVNVLTLKRHHKNDKVSHGSRNRSTCTRSSKKRNDRLVAEEEISDMIEDHATKMRYYDTVMDAIEKMHHNLSPMFVEVVISRNVPKGHGYSLYGHQKLATELAASGESDVNAFLNGISSFL